MHRSEQEKPLVSIIYLYVYIYIIIYILLYVLLFYSEVCVKDFLYTVLLIDYYI